MEDAREAAASPQERLASLVKEHQAMLLRVCYAYLCDAEDARDAVQETFFKAYKSFGGFRGECSEKNWLIQIARNTCLDMRRSAWHRHVDRRIRAEDLDSVAHPEATGEEKELTAAILQLPPKLKDTVILYYFQGLSMQETADILRISQPSVSGRLSRARKRLKAFLEGEGYDER